MQEEIGYVFYNENCLPGIFHQQGYHQAGTAGNYQSCVSRYSFLYQIII